MAVCQATLHLNNVRAGCVKKTSTKHNKHRGPAEVYDKQKKQWKLSNSQAVIEWLGGEVV